MGKGYRALKTVLINLENNLSSNVKGGRGNNRKDLNKIGVNVIS